MRVWQVVRHDYTHLPFFSSTLLHTPPCIDSAAHAKKYIFPRHKLYIILTDVTGCPVNSKALAHTHMQQSGTTSMRRAQPCALFRDEAIQYNNTTPDTTSVAYSGELWARVDLHRLGIARKDKTQTYKRTGVCAMERCDVDICSTCSHAPAHGVVTNDPCLAAFICARVSKYALRKPAFHHAVLTSTAPQRHASHACKQSHTSSQPFCNIASPRRGRAPASVSISPPDARRCAATSLHASRNHHIHDSRAPRKVNIFRTLHRGSKQDIQLGENSRLNRDSRSITTCSTRDSYYYY